MSFFSIMADVDLLPKYAIERCEWHMSDSAIDEAFLLNGDTWREKERRVVKVLLTCLQKDFSFFRKSGEKKCKLKLSKCKIKVRTCPKPHIFVVFGIVKAWGIQIRAQICFLGLSPIWPKMWVLTCVGHLTFSKNVHILHQSFKTRSQHSPHSEDSGDPQHGMICWCSGQHLSPNNMVPFSSLHCSPAITRMGIKSSHNSKLLSGYHLLWLQYLTYQSTIDVLIVF